MPSSQHPGNSAGDNVALMSTPLSRLAFAFSGLLALSAAGGAGCSSSSSHGAGGAGGGPAGSGGAAGQTGGGGHAGSGGAAGASATGGAGTGGAAGAAGMLAGMGGGGAAGSAAGDGGSAGSSASGGASGRAGAAGNGGAAGSAASSGGAGGAIATTCGPGTFGGGETALTPSSVTAAVVDGTGAPISGQPAMACGIDLCTAVQRTDASGKIVLANQFALKKPALRLGDALAYTQLSIPLTMATTDLTAGGKTLTLGKLSNKAGATLAAGTAAASGDVTLILAAGTTVSIDTLTYGTPDAQMFRSASIPVGGLVPWLASVQLGGAPANFSLFYGVAPLETTFCPPAKVTIALPHATASPNDLGWAPGTVVELWITSGDVSQAYAPYGGWRKMSDGVVGSDGASISTLAGQGFSVLDNFAVRKAP